MALARTVSWALLHHHSRRATAMLQNELKGATTKCNARVMPAAAVRLPGPRPKHTLLRGWCMGAGV